MEALGGGLGGLWNSNHPFRKRPKKPDSKSKSKSSDSAAATGRAGYQFPLKQAVTAGSLAFAGDTIAQLRERWTKREPLNFESNALTKVSGNSKLLLFLFFFSILLCCVWLLRKWGEKEVWSLKLWELCVCCPLFGCQWKCLSESRNN